LRYNLDQYDTLDLPATKGEKRIEKLNLGTDRMSLAYPFDTLALDFNSYLTKLDTTKMKLTEGESLIPHKAHIRKNQLILTGLEPGKNYTLSLDSQALRHGMGYNKSQTYYS
jgi:hypothetical protein